MWSPLETCSTIFLRYHEKAWFNNPSNSRPNFYPRYVDDTVLLFSDHSHINPFLSCLNSQHPNIKFTCKVEENNKLSFLDTSITFQNGDSSVNTYKKPTFIGLGLHFLSYLPLIHNLNSLETLVNRACNICSMWAYFNHPTVKWLFTLNWPFFYNWFINMFSILQVFVFFVKRFSIWVW